MINKNIIEFYPTTEQAKMFPPVPMKDKLPEWYKKLPVASDGSEFTAEWFNDNEHGTTHTIKRCVPVLDYLTGGYSIQTNTDILFSVDLKNEEQSYQWRMPTKDTDSVLSGHPHSQCPVKIGGLQRHYLKFYSGWVAKTPPGYSCLIYPSYYNFEDRITLFPAIVDTDKFDGMAGASGIIQKNSGNFKIAAGTPILTMFPFKREDWKLKVHNEIFDLRKSKNLTLVSQFFNDHYRNFFHSKKRFD